jgi:hypothetical protein
MASRQSFFQHSMRQTYACTAATTHSHSYNQTQNKRNTLEPNAEGNSHTMQPLCQHHDSISDWTQPPYCCTRPQAPHCCC